MSAGLAQFFSGGDPTDDRTRNNYRTWFDPSAIAAVQATGLMIGLGLIVVLLAADANRFIGFLAACAIAAAGSVFGFLFGIPRSLEGAAPAASDKPGAAGGAAPPAQNAGLEQVADWLTKILLGAGLTQLGEVKRIVLRLSDWISACVCTDASHGASVARVFGFAVVVYFGALGFLAGYLATRLLLARLLRKADKTLEEIAKGVGKEEGVELGKKQALDAVEKDIVDLTMRNLVTQVTNAVAFADDAGKARALAAQSWMPAAPAKVDDDPQKLRFGGKSDVNGRKLSATVTPLKSDDSELFRINLSVESTDPAKPLDDAVKFFLHHTFDPSTCVVLPKKGVAALNEVISWGAFTVGVMTDGGKTELELDLALLTGAPAKFRSR